MDASVDQQPATGRTNSRNHRETQAMPDDELARMDDPEFLAERRRVREELEQTPVASADLTARYAALDDEFIRRARAAWVRASSGGAQCTR
jgi:hypothetical protein